MGKPPREAVVVMEALLDETPGEHHVLPVLLHIVDLQSHLHHVNLPF